VRLALARRVVNGYRADDCGFLASAVAYQLFLSFLPLLILVVGIFGLFLNSQQLREEATALLRELYPGLGERRLVDELVASRGLTLGIGIVGTLWSVGAIYASLDRALLGILGGQRHGFIRGRLQGIAFALMLTAIALASFALSFLVQALAGWLRGVGIAPSERLALELLGPLAGFLAGFVLFDLILLIVPRRRLPRSARLAGAFTAAALWEVAKVGFAILAREAHVFSTFGVLALAAGLLTWTYVSALILLLGAEVMKAWPEPAR
jgi:membrane protein